MISSNLPTDSSLHHGMETEHPLCAEISANPGKSLILSARGAPLAPIATAVCQPDGSPIAFSPTGARPGVLMPPTGRSKGASMAVKFLSDEWLSEVESRLNGSEAFQTAAKGQAARLQQQVAGAPAGDIG